MSNDKKLTASRVFGMIMRKLLSPSNLATAFKKARQKAPRGAKRRKDEQLKLFTSIVPGDFIHYGFFEDGTTEPEAISLQDIAAAQLAYGSLLVDEVVDLERPVLDVGCGAGGLFSLLQGRNLTVQGVTPDEHQVSYIAEKYPDVPIFAGTFEQFDHDGHREHFGTVITSESYQYLKQDEALPGLAKIVVPGGRWILCDYFVRQEKTKKVSGHVYADFRQRVDEGPWKVVVERDITANVLPGLAYASMWGERIIRPLFDFVNGKIARKAPATHFVIEDVLTESRQKMDEMISLVDPEKFAAEKQYMFLVMERDED